MNNIIDRSKNEITTTLCLQLTFWQTHAKKYGPSTRRMCTSDYRTCWHLLVKLRKYVPLVRRARLWDVADACVFRTREVAKGWSSSKWDQFLSFQSQFIRLLLQVSQLDNLCFWASSDTPLHPQFTTWRLHPTSTSLVEPRRTLNVSTTVRPLIVHGLLYVPTTAFTNSHLC
jgi:hypothetical protein